MPCPCAYVVCCEVKCGAWVGCGLAGWMVLCVRGERRGMKEGKCGHEVSLGICTSTCVIASGRQ